MYYGHIHPHTHDNNLNIYILYIIYETTPQSHLLRSCSGWYWSCCSHEWCMQAEYRAVVQTHSPQSTMASSTGKDILYSARFACRLSIEVNLSNNTWKLADSSNDQRRWHSTIIHARSYSWRSSIRNFAKPWWIVQAWRHWVTRNLLSIFSY